jgi:hypothetical protein
MLGAHITAGGASTVDPEIFVRQEQLNMEVDTRTNAILIRRLEKLNLELEEVWAKVKAERAECEIM